MGINHYFIQNLNQNPEIPPPDRNFDAVGNCVSIQYLQSGALFAEIHPIPKPGSIARSASPAGCSIERQLTFYSGYHVHLHGRGHVLLGNSCRLEAQFLPRECFGVQQFYLGACPRASVH